MLKLSAKIHKNLESNMIVIFFIKKNRNYLKLSY
jgi:hypothetical protein